MSKQDLRNYRVCVRTTRWHYWQSHEQARLLGMTMSSLLFYQLMAVNAYLEDWPEDGRVQWLRENMPDEHLAAFERDLATVHKSIADEQIPW